MYLLLKQRGRTTKGKIGPVDFSKNEDGRVCLKEYYISKKEYYISKWIPAEFMFVFMTSFSN